MQDGGVPSSLLCETQVFCLFSLWPASFHSFPFLYFTFWNVQLTLVLGGWMCVHTPSEPEYQIVLFSVFFKWAGQVTVLRKSHLLQPFLHHMV